MKALLTCFVESHRAGSPTDEKVYWISLKPWQLAKLFYEQPQIQVSHGLVKRVLREWGYGYRKQAKQLSTGAYARRDEQFHIICSLVLVMSLQSPVLIRQPAERKKSGWAICTGLANAIAPVRRRSMTMIMNISLRARSSHMASMTSKRTRAIFLLAVAVKRRLLWWIICCGGGSNTEYISTRMLKTFCSYVMQAERIAIGTLSSKPS